MNILFITHHYLHASGGGCYATSAYINAFAQIADSMTLLYPMKFGASPKFVNMEKINAVPIPYNYNKIIKFWHLLCGRVHRYTDIDKHIDANVRYDIVVFDTSMVSYRLIDYFHEKGCKVICIHHNYQYEYFRDNSIGIIKYLTLLWCRKYERDAVRKSDINLTLTNSDIQLLRKNYGTGKELFYKIGVFEYQFSPNKTPVIQKGRAIRFVITGVLDSYQTEQSLIPWITDYYPILCKYYENHQLLIAGRSPSEKLYNTCKKHESIKIVANPKDMNDVLKECDVYVCPVCMGGGLKLRIMDGLKFGMRIITHTISARGYEEFQDKKYLFPYDDIESFENAIYDLKSSSDAKGDIISLYHAVFSFESGINRIGHIVNKLKTPNK